MKKRANTKRILPGLGFVVLVLVLGYAALRPFAYHWGATREEAQRPMPGDTGGPAWTRAISVRAAPEQIWPWLVQFGQGRGGWYSYDWLENLFGLDIHTAQQIQPELQNPTPGTDICLGPGFCNQVSIVEPNHYFGWQARAEDGHTVWNFIFGLYPGENGVTRLVVRESFDAADMPAVALLFLEGPDLVMEQKALNTLKDRAEGRLPSALTTPLEIGLWLAALVVGGFAGVWVIRREHWQGPLVLGGTALLVLLVISFLFPPLWLRAVLAALLAGGWVIQAREVQDKKVYTQKIPDIP